MNTNSKNITTNKTIYIGGDHASYEVREKVQKYLFQIGFEVVDEGSYNKEPANYAYYALKIAKKVQKNKDSLGILICGSGIGVNIAANKVKGIKSNLLYSVKSAERARSNNVNVISLGSRFSSYKNIQEYINIFLNIKDHELPDNVNYQYFDIKK